jgi:hypothetical protein
MRSDVFIAAAVTVALIVSGIPFQAGEGASGGRTPDADNDFASATALTSGTAYPGTLDSSDDPQDYFSAQSAAPGQVFNISVQVSSYPTGTVRLVAYDPSMAMLEQSNLGGQWESLSIDAVKWNTKYYFVVFLASGTVATYSIQVVLETPKTIAWSGSDGGNLDRSSDNPADWYVFSLAGGGTNDVAVFTIWHDPAVTIDAWLYDLWPGLTTSVCNISLNHTSGKTISMAGPHSDPWYHLKIWARSGSGAYSVSMGPQQTIPGDNDYNADNAHRLNNTAQTGYLDSAWDHFAYYKCFLTQGENLRVRMNLTQNVPGKFNLYIYHVISGTYYQDTNSSNFIMGTGWTNSVTITWTAQADNMYYIVTMADEAHDANGNPASGASNASFTLRIEQPDPLNHAPVVSSPPPNPTHIPEDSVNLLLSDYYLRIVFTEPDGEEMKFTVTGSGNISLRLLEPDAIVFATTTPDWSGIELITITATDTSGKTTVLKVNIQVDQVPDAPVQIKPIENQTVVEDEELIMDLSEYFTDPDIPYVYGEHLEYRVMKIDPAAPTIPWRTDNETQTLTFGPARNIYHQKEYYYTRSVTLRLTDKGGDQSHAKNVVFNLNVTPINHPPIPNQTVIFIIMDEDEVDTSTNVPAHFTDYDLPLGDVLQFKAERSEHINATIRTGYILEVKPEKDWNGVESLYLTATDRYNATASIEVNVTVNPVNDPPQFESWSPVTLEWCMTETESLNFSVEVTDADSNLSALTYTWFVDNVRQFGASGPRFTFSTDFNTARLAPYVISVNVSDGDDNSTMTWYIQVQNKNRPPVVTITSPQPGGIYPEGQMIRLSADATDPEPDTTLAFIWKEGTIALGKTRSLNWKFTAGSHTVSVLVDDGTDTTQVNVTFFSDSIPTVNITSPEDRKHYKTTQYINFSATVNDKDGDTVTVQWRERAKSGKDPVLSNAANFTKKLGKGPHEIYINATDGRNWVETPTMLIFVDEPPKQTGFLPGFELYSALAAMLAAVAAVSIFWRGRRGCKDS